MLTFDGYHVGGWIPDPKKPSDYAWSQRALIAQDGCASRLFGGDASAAEIVLPERTPISDQGPEPTCVGNAVGDAFELIAPEVVQVSRKFIFAMSCFEAGVDGRSGTFIRSAIAGAARHGVCTEAVYPYSSSSFERPTVMALRAAAARKIHTFYRITETGGDRLDEIDGALANGLPVVFGTQVGRAFANWRPGDAPLLPPVNDANVGGHAIVIVGRAITPQGRVYRIRNSWGTGYGDRGFALFDESYLAWNWTLDLWVPTAAPVLG